MPYTIYGLRCIANHACNLTRTRSNLVAFFKDLVSLGAKLINDID